jgi:hypothetical protein
MVAYVHANYRKGKRVKAHRCDLAGISCRPMALAATSR